MELNICHQHIILYAKGHYPMTKNVVQDLQIIVEHFCCVSRKHITQMDVLKLVATIYQETFLKNYPHQGLEELFDRVFASYFHKVDVSYMVEFITAMLGKIGIVEIKYLLPIVLPEKDEKLYAGMKMFIDMTSQSIQS